MKLGYAKGGVFTRDIASFEKERNRLGVEKLFVDSERDNRGLHEALRYAREGDILITETSQYIGRDAGEFIKVVLQINAVGVTLLCRRQKIDTSSLEWQCVLASLQHLNTAQTTRSDKVNPKNPRLLDELDYYFTLVAAKEITVDEVCERLKIGRSTYYRRWRTHGPHAVNKVDEE